MDKNNKPSAIDYSPMNDAHWKLLDAVTKYLEASRSILLSGSYNDEPTPEEKRRIAGLIRKSLALRIVREVRCVYLTAYCMQNREGYEYNACAWGLAYIGLFDSPEQAYKARSASYEPSWVVIREALGVSERYFNKIDGLHKDKNMSAGAIADALEQNII